MSCPTAAILAQSSSASLGSVIIWSGVLLLILILAFAAYSRLKRWMNEADEPAAVGFTFSDLRKLHQQGQLTTEEFEAARLKMLASARRMTEELPSPLVDGRKPPAAAGPVEPGSNTER